MTTSESGLVSYGCHGGKEDWASVVVRIWQMLDKKRICKGGMLLTSLRIQFGIVQVADNLLDRLNGAVPESRQQGKLGSSSLELS